MILKIHPPIHQSGVPPASYDGEEDGECTLSGLEKGHPLKKLIQLGRHIILSSCKGKLVGGELGDNILGFRISGISH